MTKLIFILFAQIILIDSLVIDFGRRLLLDFLIGKHNRKVARDIHSKQALLDRITMNYIKKVTGRERVFFCKFQRVYLFEVITLLPQYIFLIGGSFLLNNKIRFAFYVFLLIKVIIFFYFRLQFDANRVSKYANKRK